jgi:hypothetical protein
LDACASLKITTCACSAPPNNKRAKVLYLYTLLKFGRTRGEYFSVLREMLKKINSDFNKYKKDKTNARGD